MNQRISCQSIALIISTFAILTSASTLADSSVEAYVQAQGDYHARSAPGSLEKFVVDHARRNAFKDGVRKCRFAGFEGKLINQADEALATGIENGSFWATVDVTYGCTRFTANNPVVLGSGVGNSIISVPNAKALAKSRALELAMSRCEHLEFYALPLLRKIVDNHWSCVGHDCTAWFSGVYECQ